MENGIYDSFVNSSLIDFSFFSTDIYVVIPLFSNPILIRCVAEIFEGYRSVRNGENDRDPHHDGKNAR